MENELAQILGVTYDSLEQRLLKEAEQEQVVSVHVSVSLANVETHNGNIEYKYTFSHNDKVIEGDVEDFIEMINIISPYYFLELNEYSGLITSQNGFKCVCNGQVTSHYAQDTRLLFTRVLGAYLKSLKAIPTQYSLDLTITKTSKPEYVKKWCALVRSQYAYSSRHNSNYLSCEKLAENILSDQYSTSTYRTRKPYHFEGSFKSKLYQNLQKEVLIFTIEYLWNKKINKTASFKEIGRNLCGLPNNFRLNDCQEIIQLYNVVAYSKNDIKSMYNELVKLRQPVGDLKRWQKDLQNEEKVEAKKLA